MDLSMRFILPLTSATVIKRYKRFLADVLLTETNEQVTIHCPNSGSMMGLQMPGTKIWMSRSLNPNRKLAYTWEISEVEDTLVGINTQIPNTLVYEALCHGVLPSLKDYTEVLREVNYGQNSRIDFLLKAENIPPCYVEVKNVTLNLDGIAAFPDSVTTRGTKHLTELTHMKNQGYRAVMLYIVQRSDLKSFKVAEKIDSVYAEASKKARHAGVETLVLSANVSLQAICLGAPLMINR